MRTQGNTMLLSAFDDPILDSQQTFRAILEAMSHPGRILKLPVAPEAPSPIYPSAAAICLTLLDLDTPLWLDALAHESNARAYLQFHCGCPIVDNPKSAAFALVAASRKLPSLDAFALGDPLYPEQAATVIIQVHSLSTSHGWKLSGPGILNPSHLHAEGLSGAFTASFKANRMMFPQGVDVVLVSPDSLCGLPRTVSIES